MTFWYSPDDEISQGDLERGMRLVFYDGLTTQAMSTLTSGVFLTAFALELSASNLLVGILAAIPFLGQLMQVPAIILVERLRLRRFLTVTASMAARILLLLIALAAFLPPGLALGLLIVGLTLYAGAGAISACSWNSWMRCDHEEPRSPPWLHHPQALHDGRAKPCRPMTPSTTRSPACSATG